MNLSDDPIARASSVANIALHRQPHAPDNHNASIIKQTADELRSLEHDAELQMQALTARVGALRRQIAIHDALLHPWRRLPPEILSEVFRHAVPDDWTAQFVGRRILNFAQVCHAWRCAAFAMPRLWTTLRFLPHFNPPVKHVAALRADLAKTAQAPLEVEMCMSASAASGYGERDARWSDEVWELLCEQAHRWEYALLNSLPMVAYERLLGRSFPLLHTLSMTVNSYEDVIHLPIQVFENAPRVHSLSITGDSAPILPFTLPSNWALTELSILFTEACTLAPHVGVILACCDTLRECHLTSDASCANLPPPANFPFLELLDLGGNATALCHVFTAPNLQSLHMDTWNSLDDDFNAFVALQSMLARSGDCPSLRKLTLNSLDSGPQGRDLIASLRSLSSLEELGLQNRDYTDDTEPSLITLDLLRAMVRDADDPSSLAFLPNLTQLSVVFGDDYNNGADPADPEVRSVLRAIPESRTQAMSADGRALALLQRYYNNAGGDLKGCCLPPLAEDPSDSESDVSMDEDDY
ncbi:uncharacterized protein SCHCODRAFT_02533179 [Schizophyllum commune H4-8]|nr:uncharacterized protein SCHCODRAFT_02533179 [Schizophyllum commune H4-8]KAI5896779.1 hypothetical protein SCHCODRAFT_02533179 [Schizophyllum commune H4-8]